MKQLKGFVAGQRVQHIGKQPIGGMTMLIMPSKIRDVCGRNGRRKGSCSKEKYTEAKKWERRGVYEEKTKADAEQLGNLSTNKKCIDNAFKIASQMKSQNKDVIGGAFV